MATTQMSLILLNNKNSIFFRYVLKLEATEITVKFVFGIEPAKKQITQSVDIVVAGSDAGAIQVNLIGGVSFL